MGSCIQKGIKIVLKRRFLPWIKENITSPEFLKKVREAQGQRTKEFLESLLNQDLVPNFRPKSPCKCPNFAKLAYKHKVQLASKHKAPNSDSIQVKHVTTHDSIPVTVGKAQAQNGPENNRHIGKQM